MCWRARVDYGASMNIRSTSTLATNKFEAEINSVLVWFDSRDPVQDHLACDVSDLVTRHPW
jgi:hypothetical protein